MFCLRTLGGATIERDGVVLDSVGTQRKTLALLALLAVARHQGISRDRLAAYLWPESDGERARGALKQALYVARRSLGSPDAILGTSELRLNPSRVRSDVDEFLTALEQGDLHRAAAVYGGPFLDGFHLSGAGEFEQWADAQRDHLARKRASALEQLAREAEADGDYPAAVEQWRRLHSEDPLSGRATLALMNALDAAGERAAAIRCAAVHEALLRDEVGSPPDAAVAALAARFCEEPYPPAAARDRESRPQPGSSVEEDEPVWIATGNSAAAARAARPRLARPVSVVATALVLGIGVSIPGQETARDDTTHAAVADRSIAVMPFRVSGEDPRSEHLARSLTDELIGALGRVQGLRVAARTSTLALDGRGLDAIAIADSLGVATVLEGSVRRTRDRVQVTVRLVNVRDEGVVWAKTYDREVRDVFAVQNEIARAIARAVNGGSAGEDAAVLVGRPTDDLEAYDLYLRARHTWTLPQRERLEQAVIFYGRAVERDPTFAVAYAGLAEAYANLGSYAYLPSDQALARANLAAERALQLDPRLAEAHAAHGFVLTSEQEFEAAEAAFRRAIALNPSYVWAHHHYSLLLMMLGRTDEAFEHNRQALLLDPLSLPANATRGIILSQQMKYVAARVELERALLLDRDYLLTLFYLGAIRAAEGAYEEALPLLEAAALRAPAFTGVPGALAYVYDRTGRKPAADSILARLQHAAVDDRSRANLAFAYAVRGRMDLAFPILQRVRWDKPSVIELRADPLLGALRADPRYRQLIRQIGADEP